MYYDRKISAAMRECKRLRAPVSLKSVSEDGRFAGYASVFGVVDSHADVVERGAFTDTIRGRKHAIKLLWQHQQDAPIGVITELFEDGKGLFMEGRLLHEVARAREALALMKAGALNGLSIGYSPTRYVIDPVSGVRRLKEVELWEISLVTFPANSAAQVTVVKSGSIQQADSPIPSAVTLPLLEALGRAAGVLCLKPSHYLIDKN